MRRGLLFPLILIPLAALVAVLPLVAHGCSCGHDFDFHLISWMEAAAQFKAGVWHPAWAFSPAWNAGEPRFVFYPPISWTLGALLGMAFPWAAVPIVYTWLALAASGFGMYWLAREVNSSRAGAVVAAAVYIANPYMIFTAYERTAYAELLAAAWIPLLLAAVVRERVTVLRVAVPVTLLWLTNAPAAVMGCYALALLTAARVAWMWMRRISTLRACAWLAACLTARAAGGLALGLGLAAFYVLPAAYERPWVQIAMAMVSGMRIGDNFLFHQTGDGPHDEVLHTASTIAVSMLVSAAAVLGAAGLQLRNRRTSAPTAQCVVSPVSESRPGAPSVLGWSTKLCGRGTSDAGSLAMEERILALLAVLAAAIGLLLTPLSASVWRVAPEMAFLQFPWRLTSVLAAAVCGVVPFCLKAFRIKNAALAAGALVLVAAIGWPTVRPFRQACEEEDTVSARLAVFVAKTGTDPTDEYTPGESNNDALRHSDPPFWLGEDGDAQPPQTGAGQVPMHFEIDAKTAEALILNLRDYPAWVVRLNGTVVRQRMERPDGLIAFPVAAGRSRIDIAYATTRDRSLGDGISVVALCGAIGWVAVGRRRSGSGIGRIV